MSRGKLSFFLFILHPSAFILFFHPPYPPPHPLISALPKPLNRETSAFRPRLNSLLKGLPGLAVAEIVGDNRESLPIS